MAFTYFFRDLQTLNSIKEHVIPHLLGRRYIDIWDAGCAMGPEPYSLAIILRESMGHFMFRNVRLFATDIDNSNLFEEIVTKGVYPYDQVKRIPTNMFRDYFSPANVQESEYVIREDLKCCLRYQRHDLLTLKPIRANLGLILCKNVLLHFKEDQRVAVIKMFHKALGDVGFLVTEQTQTLPKQTAHLFEPVVPNARVYRKVTK